MRAESLDAAPDVGESEDAEYFRVLALGALVRMKLTSFLLTDRVDIRDLVDVEQVDASWPARFLPELGARLQQLLDTPDG